MRWSATTDSASGLRLSTTPSRSNRRAAQEDTDDEDGGPDGEHPPAPPVGQPTQPLEQRLLPTRHNWASRHLINATADARPPPERRSES